MDSTTHPPYPNSPHMKSRSSQGLRKMLGGFRLFAERFFYGTKFFERNFEAFDDLGG